MFTRIMGRPRHRAPLASLIGVGSFAVPLDAPSTAAAPAPVEAASACSEFLAPNDAEPDDWKVLLLHAKAACWSLLGLGVLLLVLWAKKP